MTSLNRRAFLAVNSFAEHTGWLHGAAVAFARYGILLFGLALALAVIRSRRLQPTKMAAALWAGAGSLLALGLNQPLGQLFHASRPYARYPDALLLVPATTDFSLPSDHAVVAGAVAAGLWIAWRRLGRLAVVAAVVMAVDRVYVGAHYPADVLAGLVFGSVFVGLSWLVVRRPAAALVIQLRSSPLRPLLVAGVADEVTSGRT